MTITPTILAPSFEHVVERLFLLEGVTEWVQIDVCDGIFGLERTWLPKEGAELPSGFSYEFDIMVKDWRKYLQRTISLGAKRVVMHIDTFSEDDIAEMIAMVKPHFIYLGLCVSNDKNVPGFVSRVHAIESVYTKIFIQVMGIKHIGAQGQPFDESCIKRISYIHNECRNIDIQVDGSMNNETVSQVKNAGARCAIVGSYVLGRGATHESVKEKLETLRNNYR